MSIRDLRNRARASLHEAMHLPAIYIAPGPGGAETDCKVRIHHRKQPFGDMTGFDYAPVERLEAVPEIVALVAEIDPEIGGVFSIESGEAYRVENPLLPDGLTVTSQVTRLDLDEAAGLSTPD